VCVTAARRVRQEALAHLGPLRLLRSDLVVVSGADALGAGEMDELRGEIGRWTEAPVIACRLEPEPAEPLPPGARVALFTTAPSEAERAFREATERHDADVVVYSSALARRAELERDLDRAGAERCELFLCELKAAAVECVAERAAAERLPLVWMRNRPQALPGEPSIDEALLSLASEAGVEATERPGVPA
jgi:predicted GTPase